MEFPHYEVFPIPGFAEPVSCLTHIIGAVVFCFLAVSLFRRAKKERSRNIALKIYVCSVVALLTLSGLYHLFARGEVVRDVLQRLDHATIFVLIAATFTPVHVVLLQGIWRWGVIVTVWLLAAVGMVLSIGFLHTIPESVDLCFYLGMGWFGALSGFILWRRFGFWFISPLLWGALAYTIGAVIDFIREPILIPSVVGPHEVFHLAVLAGISYHWFFIRSFAGASVAQCPTTGNFLLDHGKKE